MDLKVSYTHGIGERKTTRERIVALQGSLSELPDAIFEEQLEAELNTHYFAPGIYGRKMRIPADMCVVGKIHLHAHLNIITYGLIKVVTEFGEEFFEGPHTFVSEPGTKRAVVAITDTEWITIHHNPENLTDTRELEKRIIAPDFATFDRLQLGPGVEA